MIKPKIIKCHPKYHKIVSLYISLSSLKQGWFNLCRKMGTVWYAQTDIETERDPTSFIKRFNRF